MASYSCSPGSNPTAATTAQSMKAKPSISTSNCTSTSNKRIMGSYKKLKKSTIISTHTSCTNNNSNSATTNKKNNYYTSNNSNLPSSKQQQQQKIDQLLTICGACEHPLSLPPPPASPRNNSIHTNSAANSATNSATNSANSADEDYRVITCANFLRKQNSTSSSSSSSSETDQCTKCQAIHPHTITSSSTSSSSSSSSSSSNHERKRNILSSPKFHFCCAGIPKNSFLYSQIQQSLDKQQQQQQQQQQQLSVDISSNDIPPPTTPSPSLPSSPSSSSIVTTKTVASEFLCPACDIKGTSMYLYEYFSIIHQLKVEYYKDEDAIYSIQPVGHPWNDLNGNDLNGNDLNGNGDKQSQVIRMKDVEEKEISSKSTTSNGNMSTTTNMAMDNGFVSFLLEREMKKNQNMLPVQTTTERNESTKTTCTDESTTPRERFRNTEMRLDHIQNILQRIPSSTKKGNDDDKRSNLHCLDPTYFVGQPIRLFCFVTNCYYTGRIVASKVIQTKDVDRLKDTTKNKYKKGILHHQIKNVKNQPKETKHQHRILLDRDIGKTMYLVRFRPGVEGRKVAVHEWIFLEEHPIMLAFSLVWANTEMFQRGNGEKVEKKRRSRVGYNSNKMDENLTMFRPAQMFVRTALEMLMWDDINQFSTTTTTTTYDNEQRDSVNALGVFMTQNFIGTVFRFKKEYARLENEGNDSMKEGSGIIDDEGNDDCQSEEKKEIDDSTKTKNSIYIKHLLAADFINPPMILQSHLNEGKSTDEPLNVSVSLATMEAEEQNRVKQHTLRYDRVTGVKL